MFTITAQELKTGGLTGIKKLLQKTKELFIQERGKESCVIVDLEYFNQLKMCEVEVAYLKAQEDIKDGQFEVVTDMKSHVDKILLEIDAESNSSCRE